MSGFQHHTPDAEPSAWKRLLAASTIQQLIDLGVTSAITIWPEWGPAFTHLDKGGSPGHPGIENRPMAPPPKFIGKRVAFHVGAHIGGRKGEIAREEGWEALIASARANGWDVGPASAGVFDGGLRGYLVVRDDTKVEFIHRASKRRVLVKDVDISRGALLFTAVITGFEPPTATPAHPWQRASDPENSESWSYGWHIADVVPLTTPIPCAGLQGLWPLTAALNPRSR